MSFGKQVWTRRRELGLSGRELARQLGVSASFLSDIELDRRWPGKEVFERLVRALKMDTHEAAWKLAQTRLEATPEGKMALERITELEQRLERLQRQVDLSMRPVFGREQHDT